MPKATSPLARGLACLCCRKRKLRCDGGRPICHQCLKVGREKVCEYDENAAKSRTQKLRERLSLLEGRLQELESKSNQSPTTSNSAPSDSSFNQSIAINDGEVNTGSVSSSKSALVSSSSPLSSWSPADLHFHGCFGGLNIADHQQWAGASSSSLLSENLPGIFNSLGNFELERNLDFNATSYMFQQPMLTLPHWDPNTPLPQEHRTVLTNIFLCHRQQLWFSVDISRFDTGGSLINLLTPLPEPHPALLNAIYLLGCHFSRSPYFSDLEPRFFDDASTNIMAALEASDRLVDIIQASCLLAVYLYINCRFLEGYCHAFSAARLAVALGLHQIPSPSSFGGPGTQGPHGSAPVALQIQDLELRDRISTFWQVFIVDRCWNIANGLPLALPDGDGQHARIKTPWPMPAPHDTMNTTYYLPALKAKAVALLERSGRLTTASEKDEEYWLQYSSVGLALQRLLSSLPTFLGHEPWRTQAPFMDVELFSIHTYVYVAVVHLYSNTNAEESARGVQTILSLIQQLDGGDFEYLDPTLSAAWTCVAKACMRTISVTRNNGADPLPDTEGELDVICNAMRGMSIYFPIAGEHAKKVEEERARNRGTNSN